jgi:hypothetical protein
VEIDTPFLSILLTLEMDTPCSSIFLAVEINTPCSSILLAVKRVHPANPFFLRWKWMDPAHPFFWLWKGIHPALHIIGTKAECFNLFGKCFIFNRKIFANFKSFKNETRTKMTFNNLSIKTLQFTWAS